MHCNPEGRTFWGVKAAKTKGENMTTFAHQNQICCLCIRQHILLKCYVSQLSNLKNEGESGDIYKSDFIFYVPSTSQNLVSYL